jgi:hypothetical protein
LCESGREQGKQHGDEGRAREEMLHRAISITGVVVDGCGLKNAGSQSAA